MENIMLLPPEIRELEGNFKAHARGKRLRYLREFAKMNRDELSEIAGVKYVTYKDWENGHWRLPLKRATRIVEALIAQGFECSVEWLETGRGKPPAWSEQKKMQAELDFFCKINPNAISLTVDDEGMMPQYAIGDIVAGVKCGLNEASTCLNRDCIVELPGDKLLLRNLRKGKQENRFNLMCLNLEFENPLLTDVQIKSIAPVIWVRRLR